MAFCFKCVECGARFEQREREPAPACIRHELYMVRDYKAEGVGIGSGVRVSRDGTVSEQAKQFLPDNSEFAGPGDPDGTKGMREWHETHQPKESVRRQVQLPGHIEKKSF
jgi:hypothetical protein